MKLGLTLLRTIVGVLFFGHGTQKLFGWFGGHGIEGTAGFFESIGLRAGPQARHGRGRRRGRGRGVAGAGVPDARRRGIADRCDVDGDPQGPRQQTGRGPATAATSTTWP